MRAIVQTHTHFQNVEMSEGFRNNLCDQYLRPRIEWGGTKFFGHFEDGDLIGFIEFQDWGDSDNFTMKFIGLDNTLNLEKVGESQRWAGIQVELMNYGVQYWESLGKSYLWINRGKEEPWEPLTEAVGSRILAYKASLMETIPAGILPPPEMWHIIPVVLPQGQEIWRYTRDV